MKTLIITGLLLLAAAMPGQAQEVLPELCGQHSTIYDPTAGFCIFPDRPDVFTTTRDDILVDIRQDPDSQSYMVQAFDLAAQELTLAVVLDASRQPARFLLGDAAMVQTYQEQIDAGLDLLDRWQPLSAVK